MHSNSEHVWVSRVVAIKMCTDTQREREEATIIIIIIIITRRVANGEYFAIERRSRKRGVNNMFLVHTGILSDKVLMAAAQSR